MRTFFWIPAVVWAQVLSVGRGLDPAGRLLGMDTIFRFERPPAVLYIQYRAPSGYEKDTFILLVRNALGPLAWIALSPAKPSTSLRQARLQLPRSGVYGLFVYIKGTGSHLWASRRIYVILPPHQTLAQVKAYHNALLAQRSRQPAPSTSLQDTPPLPDPPDDPLQPSLPVSEPLDIPLPDQVSSFDDITITALEESAASTPLEEEEDPLDDP